MSAAAALAEQMRRARLLLPAQLEELPRLLASCPDARALLAELARRGWLTAYQVELLSQGRGGELEVGPYRLLEVLGQGAMARVFKARHVPMGRLVALKLVSKDTLAGPRSLARFEQEVQAAAQLAHPNVAQAYDAGEVGDVCFLAMEHVEGTDLSALVKQSGRLGIPLACECARQAALGLQHAHEKGLVHRDVKPSNLMAGRAAPGGPLVVKVLDFGLARLLEGDTGRGKLTTVGKLVGTVDYVSPEQAEDASKADARSDIYSLGCTLFYLLTGQPPFPGKDLVERLGGRLVGEAPLLRSLRPEAPAGLEAVLARMMARDPARRFSSAAETAAALGPFGPSLRPSGKPASGSMPVVPGPISAAVKQARQAIPPPPPRPAAVATARPAPPVDRPPAEETRAGDATFDDDIDLGKVKRRGVLLVAAVLFVLTFVPLLFFIRPWQLRKKPAAPEPENPDNPVAALALQVKPGTTLEVASGGSGTLTVAVARQHYQGPVELRLEGLPAGLRAAPVTLPAGQDEARLQVSADRDAKEAAATVRILARGGEAATEAQARIVVEYPVGEVRKLTGHTAAVYAVAFSADGKRILSGGIDRAVRLWGPTTDQELRRFQGHTDTVGGVGFLPSDRALSVGASGAFLWDLGSDRPLRRFTLDAGARPRLAVSPDGRHALAAGQLKREERMARLTLWDIDGSTAPRTLTGHTGRIIALGFTADSRQALSCHGAATSDRSSVIVWDAASGKEVRRVVLTERLYGPAVFSADGKLLLGVYLGALRLWDTDSGKEVRRFEGNAGALASLALSPDGRRALSGASQFRDEAARMTLWDVASGKVLRHFDGHVRSIYALAFSGDGRFAVSAGSDRTVRLWKLPKPGAAPVPPAVPVTKPPVKEEPVEVRVPKLIAALEDLSPAERRKAALALGKIGRPAARTAVPRLLTVARVTVDSELRRNAAIALMSLVGPEDSSASADLEKLLEDRGPATARAAACALALVGGPRATRGLPLLREQLRQGDALGRERAAAALANLGSLAEPALAELTTGVDDSDPIVRRNCCIALGKLGEKAKPAVTALVRALKPPADLPAGAEAARPYEQVREQAAEALALVRYPGNAEATPALRDAIARDKNQAVRQRCIWALYTRNDLDSHDLARVLADVLEEKAAEGIMVRYDAARVLAYFRKERVPDRVVEVLLDMLGNTGLRIFTGTAAQIEGSGGSTTSAVLGGDARFMAADALGWLGSKVRTNTKVAAALRRAARDKDARLRESAAKALKALGIAPGK